MKHRILILALAAFTGACASVQGTAEDVVAEARAEIDPGPTATAQLRDAQGRVVATATLQEEEDGVDIELHATGLPAGVHAFHIHETGTCTAPDFTSAGGHFNPAGAEHGFESARGPHAGDMRNIEIPASGTAHIERENERVTISPGPRSVFDANGSAIVIHQGADDYRTNPAGDAGSRIACGVITR